VHSFCKDSLDEALEGLDSLGSSEMQIGIRINCLFTVNPDDEPFCHFLYLQTK
jgi:hypothetical protein